MANLDRRPTMGRVTRALAFCALALCVESLGPSCSSGINTGPIRAFNRPVAVAFACIDSSGAAVPIAQCSLELGVPPFGFSMHALVAQETRGEVAAVDLVVRTVLDSDRRVPGYTFVPAGSLPGAIVVPPNQPRCTYVANRGSNDISVLETRRFRSATSIGVPTWPNVAVDGSPTDMVLQTDGGVDTALWVALAEEGRVIRLPILGDCVLGDPDLEIDLSATVPPGVPVGGTVDLSRTCPADFAPVPPAMIMPRDPAVDPADLAEPASLVVDDEARVLLVGDRSLPLIHRIVLGDGSVLAPIATGAPVRDVVLTPRVPDSYSPSSDPTTLSRFLYAIDEDDGSVMAIEYSDETRADFGAVIPVDVVGSARPDRIPFAAVARALEVITPDYPTGSGEDPRAGLCDIHLAPVTTPGPTFLRGVFLSIAMADGTVRFVDIYDLDAPCRGTNYGASGALTCSDDENPPTIVSDVAVYIRRHRPRSSSYSLAFGGVTELPSVFLGAATVPLLSNGTAGDSPTVPSLTRLATCPVAVGLTEPHLRPVLTTPSETPSVLDTLVCGLTDPFAIVPETWSAAWEGSLPSTGTSGANAGEEMAGIIPIDSSVDYCARGAIGSLDAVNGLPAEAPEAGYTGDLLAITGLLPSGQIERAVCRAVVGVTTVGEPQLPVLVRIARAFSRPADIQPAYVGRLEIDAEAPLIDPLNPAGRQFEGRALTVRDALDCYGDQLLTIDVRTSGAYRVLGTRSGFRSRVARDATDGHCAWDASASVLAQGRAFNDRPFVNARIAFQLTPPTRGIIGNPDVQIEITTNQAPLGVDLSFSSSSAARQMALPTYLSWSPQFSRLYAIDVERRGLVEIAVLPLAQSTSRFE